MLYNINVSTASDSVTSNETNNTFANTTASISSTGLPMWFVGLLVGTAAMACLIALILCCNRHRRRVERQKNKVLIDFPLLSTNKTSATRSEIQRSRILQPQSDLTPASPSRTETVPKPCSSTQLLQEPCSSFYDIPVETSAQIHIEQNSHVPYDVHEIKPIKFDLQNNRRMNLNRLIDANLPPLEEASLPSLDAFEQEIRDAIGNQISLSQTNLLSETLKQRLSADELGSADTFLSDASRMQRSMSESSSTFPHPDLYMKMEDLEQWYKTPPAPRPVTTRTNIGRSKSLDEMPRYENLGALLLSPQVTNDVVRWSPKVNLSRKRAESSTGTLRERKEHGFSVNDIRSHKLFGSALKLREYHYRKLQYLHAKRAKFKSLE